MLRKIKYDYLQLDKDKLMNLFLAVKNRTLIIDDVKNFSFTTDSSTGNSVTEQE